MTAINKLMKLHRLMDKAGEQGSDTGGTDSGQGSDAGKGASDSAGASGESSDDKSVKDGEGAGASAAAGGDGKKAGMSDADAALLKDVMKHKGRAESLQKDLEAAQRALENFKGLDPVRVRELVAAEEEAQRKAAEARGEYDRLVAQMAERHREEMQGATAKMSSINSENETLKQQIADLTVGNAFGTSQFVSSDLTLTPAKARVIYGAHFEFKDGRVIGYDKPAGAAERTVLVDSQGSPLAFDEAMRKIVEADPDRDQLMRSKAKSGSGSAPAGKSVTKAAASVAAAAANANLRGAAKITAGLRALAKG